MSLTSQVASEPLRRALDRLDALVDWERRDRGSPTADGSAMRVDTEPARDLCRRLGEPQRSFRAVHVAGTKGKGSVAALVAAGLLRAGVRVGLYASPHVERVGERVRVDLRELDDDSLAAALASALDAREAALSEGTPGGAATWFDVLTAAAFLAFARAGCPWAVVECGLGGRLDSTNVLAAPVAVLTSIDIEHAAVLGDTRAAIALEKAGIIAPGAQVVSGVGGESDEAGAVVRRVAAERSARLTEVEAELEATFAVRNRRLAEAALAALASLDPRLSRGPELLDDEALSRARLPGRMERSRVRGVPLVLDGAHVASSLAQLLRELEADPGLRGFPRVVLGLGREKDAASLLKVLRGRTDSLVLTRVGPGPYRDPEELRALAAALGITAEVAPTPAEALTRALDNVPPGGWCLVTGSLHLVGAIRPIARASGAGPTTPCSPSSPT